MDLVTLAEVLGADVSGTMFRDAEKAAPNLAPLVHALGCAWAARVALGCFEAALETDEQRAAFREQVQLVIDRADTKVALVALADAQGSARG